MVVTVNHRVGLLGYLYLGASGEEFAASNHAGNLDLAAAHVRQITCHAVIQAHVRPERVMNDLKSYASRALNEAGFDGSDRKRWGGTEALAGWAMNMMNTWPRRRVCARRTRRTMAVYDSRAGGEPVTSRDREEATDSS